MTRPVHDASDDALKRALRALPALAPVGDADAGALRARVLAQWQARHPGSAFDTALPVAAARRSWWRRRLWVGSAGLAAAAALATVLLVNRPDPALEELMQPDVLSQIAIGEM